MNVEQRKLSELHKTEKNIRKHSQKQIEEYVRSLKMFGQIRPLVVTEDGEILAGNGMYDALVSMGNESCDVLIVSGLSDIQKKKLMLADNKVYELGVTDMFSFEEIVKSLDGDFDVPGWDADLLRILNATEEEVSASVAQYGVADAGAPASGEAVVHGSGGSTDGNVPYIPVVRNEQTGEIMNPHEIRGEAPMPKEEAEQSARFVICPKCGEKIWL